MKITVLGAGAMGSLYGGFLAEAGNEVWLLDIWKDHVDTINEQGLCIEGISGKRSIKTIHATAVPSEIGPSDAVIVFVKSTVTDTAVREAQDLVGPNTTILTLQNGLGNIEKIASVVEKEKIIAGTTAHGSTVLGAGKIKHAGSGPTIIGEIDGRSTTRIHAIAEVFNTANIATTVSNNVIGLIWDKLLVNVGINALTAIIRLKNGQLIEFKETEDLLELAVNEALMVARAKGIQLSDADPVSHTKEVCRLTAENTASMLQDVLQKRKTEIDMINGAIVREGAKIGIHTPINTVLTNLVSVIEKNY
jgi:2-dehydropantoate 2-reductase